MKYWEIIANNVTKAGWSLGWVSAVDAARRTMWIVDAHRDGKRFIVRSDEKLTAFLELERVAANASFRSTTRIENCDAAIAFTMDQAT